MVTSLLITLREGLEASLIVGIILAYLLKTGRKQLRKPAWLGAGVAAVVSAVAGAIIFAVAGELSGIGEEIFEGLTMLLAASVLTWMIFVMRREGQNSRSSLQSKIDSSSGHGSWIGIALLTFVAVVREGIETILFLFAASRTAESPALSIAGAVFGLALAIGLGYLVYKGVGRLNLKVFFNVTSLILIVFAAGMLSHGVHELVEASVVPALIDPLWNAASLLPDESGIGHFLASLLGYNSDPSLSEVVAYCGYLVAVLWAYSRQPTDKQVKA